MFHLLLGIIYLAFISLGLPDSLLGSAWPVMYLEFSVPVSYAGVISMIISVGTIFSSLQSDRLTRQFGTGRVTAASVCMTAVSLLGFSTSGSYLELCLWAVPYGLGAGSVDASLNNYVALAASVCMTAVSLLGFSTSGSYLELCLWAVPYGLGAGSVDASLNNYVALYYTGSHMSWLHCMWGVGASLGPYIMGAALEGGHGWNMGYRCIAVLQFVLTVVLAVSLPLWKKRQTSLGPYIMGAALEGGHGWNMGYRCIAVLQFVLTVVLAVSLPLWKKRQTSGEKAACLSTEEGRRPLSIGEIVRLPGAKEILAAFFCYSALEQTAGLWAGSYLVLCRGISAEAAASFVSLFFLGITAGRAVLSACFSLELRREERSAAF